MIGDMRWLVSKTGWNSKVLLYNFFLELSIVYLLVSLCNS